MKAESNEDIVMHFIKFVIWLVWLPTLRDLIPFCSTHCWGCR